MLWFLVNFFILGVLIELYSLHIRPERLSYRCKPDRRYAEPGELFTVQTDLANPKRSMVEFLRLEERYPPSLNIEKEDTLVLYMQDNALVHRSVLFLGGRQVLHRQLTASLPARGSYVFSGATLCTGDFFGIRELKSETEQKETIVIYPARFTGAAFDQAMNRYFEELASSRNLLTDPISVIGYRDYTGREPFKAISFTQSARLNRLVVKEYEYLRDRSVNILLDISYHGDFETHKERQERVISMARTLCEQLEKRQYAYRLFTNAAIPGAPKDISVIGGTHGGLPEILRTLGRLANVKVRPTEALVAALFRLEKQKGAVVFLATREDSETKEAVRYLQSGGCSAVWSCYAAAYEKEPAERKENDDSGIL